MQDNNAVVKYAKVTTAIRVVAIILGALSFLTVVTMLVLRIADVELGEYGHSFKPFFYVSLCCTLVFAVVAFPLASYAAKRARLVELYRSYSKVLGRNPRNAVIEIHNALGADTKEIIESFVTMQKLGFFHDIFIDEQGGVVNSGRVDEGRDEFECSACGGKTAKKEGDLEVCDFCGAINEKEVNTNG